MKDILFKTEDYMFSYRVGGLLIRDGKVLMQRAAGDDGYSFIGGHVAFGETTADASSAPANSNLTDERLRGYLSLLKSNLGHSSEQGEGEIAI